jgi:hypothetical protein
MVCGTMFCIALVGRMADGWPQPEVSIIPAVWHALGDAVRGVAQLILMEGLGSA